MHGLRGLDGPRFGAVSILVVAGFLMVAGLAVAQPPPAPPDAATPRPTAPCRALDLPYNVWTRLEAPGAVDHLGSFPQEPCTFIGASGAGLAYRSLDGGASWNDVTAFPAGAITALVTQEAPAGTAFVLRTPPPAVAGDEPDSGLFVTRDFGRTFERVEAFEGMAVSGLAAAPGDRQVVYAVAAPVGPADTPPVTSLYRSGDFGRTWTPRPITLPLAPTAIGVDAGNPDIVWINSRSDARPGAPDGLWRSEDGGLTFIRMLEAVVSDIDTALVGGASRVQAATTNGLVRTRNNGESFQTFQTGNSIAAVAHEKYLPQVVVTMTDGSLLRSINEGRNSALMGNGDGFIGCGRTMLQRDEELTSFFFLTVAGCARDGHWIYRSDGRDVLGAFSPEGDSGILIGRRPRIDMQTLRDVPIPGPDLGSSGSVAFDGEILYYTDNRDTGYIHMMTPDGADLGSIITRLDIVFITYDSVRHVLWAQTAPQGGGFGGGATYLYSVSLADRRVDYLMQVPGNVYDSALSFDRELGLFRTYEHHGYEVYEINERGETVNTCEVRVGIPDANVSLNPDRGHPENPNPGFASGIAAGNGNMYLQLEDDRTIYYVSRTCELLAVLEHRRFQESTGGGGGGGFRIENDHLACDTVTFGRPAIWIRDSNAKRMVAYAVPDGFCPLDSRLTLDPQVVSSARGRPTEICAELEAGGRGETDPKPVREAEVRFFVGEALAGGASTGRTGRACVTVTPRAPAGSHIPVEAMFLGNVSYTGSRDEGTLVLAPAAPVRRVIPPPPPVVPPIPPPPVLQPAPQPPPPGRPEVPAPQYQPQPQQQAQAQAAIAMQQQEQPQLAYVRASREFESRLAEEHAMSSRRNAERAAVTAGAALVTMMAAGLALAKERLSVARIGRK